MKKIVGLLAMLALVFVLAGCPDPVNPPASVPEAGTSDPVTPPVVDDNEGGAGVEDVTPPAGDEGGEEAAPVVVWEEGLDLTASDWSHFVIVTGDKLGSTPKSVEVTYDNTGADYISLKIAGNYSGLPLGDGTIEGASLKEADKGALEGFASNVGDTDVTFTYTPTADEWAKITSGDIGGNANGFYINGHGAIIKKVTLK